MKFNLPNTIPIFPLSGVIFFPKTNPLANTPPALSELFAAGWPALKIKENIRKLMKINENQTKKNKIKENQRQLENQKNL